MSWDEDIMRRCGRRRWAWLAGWALLLLAGSAGWAAALAWSDDPARAWRGLLIAFCYVTPLAAGLVVWPAVVQLSRGRWAGELTGLAPRGLGFALPSMAIMALLAVGSPTWATWYGKTTAVGAWLSAPWLFGRDLAALAVVWVLCWTYVRRRRVGAGAAAAVALIVAYAFAFSLIGYDLVSALDWQWSSTLFGGYFFISGLYAAAVAWTAQSLFHPAGTADRRHDLAKLMVAFSILTAYLAYAHLLPIWYENMPHETRFIIPRVNFAPWNYVSIALAALVYLGPLWILLTVWAKRTAWFLGLVCLMLLAGLWVERWWLVTPMAFEKYPAVAAPANVGPAELGALAACVGLLGLGAAIIAPRANDLRAGASAAEGPGEVGGHE